MPGNITLQVRGQWILLQTAFNKESDDYETECSVTSSDDMFSRSSLPRCNSQRSLCKRIANLFSAQMDILYVEACIVQIASEVHKVMQEIRTIPAHEVDRASIGLAKEFAEVRKNDPFIHTRILNGQEF